MRAGVVLAMTAGSAHSAAISYTALRHCEERSDEAIQLCGSQAGLLRCARNDGGVRTFAVISYTALRHCLRQTRSVCAGSEATKQSSFAVRAGLLRAHTTARESPEPTAARSYMFSTRPYASSTASFIISDSVGCGNTVCISSSSVVSRFIATT